MIILKKRTVFAFLIFFSECLKTPEPESSAFENQSWVPGDDGKKKNTKKRKKNVQNDKMKKNTNLKKEKKVERRKEALKRKPFGGKSPRFLFKQNQKKNPERNIKKSGIYIKLSF